jgi:hypothetical protein
VHDLGDFSQKGKGREGKNIFNAKFANIVNTDYAYLTDFNKLYKSVKSVDNILHLPSINFH